MKKMNFKYWFNLNVIFNVLQVMWLIYGCFWIFLYNFFYFRDVKTENFKEDI